MLRVDLLIEEPLCESIARVIGNIVWRCILRKRYHKVDFKREEIKTQRKRINLTSLVESPGDFVFIVFIY